MHTGMSMERRISEGKGDARERGEHGKVNVLVVLFAQAYCLESARCWKPLNCDIPNPGRAANTPVNAEQSSFDRPAGYEITSYGGPFEPVYFSLAHSKRLFFPLASSRPLLSFVKSMAKESGEHPEPTCCRFPSIADGVADAGHSTKEHRIPAVKIEDMEWAGQAWQRGFSQPGSNTCQMLHESRTLSATVVLRNSSSRPNPIIIRPREEEGVFCGQDAAQVSTSALWLVSFHELLIGCRERPSPSKMVLFFSQHQPRLDKCRFLRVLMQRRPVFLILIIFGYHIYFVLLMPNASSRRRCSGQPKGRLCCHSMVRC